MKKMMQQTLAKAVGTTGIGLHSGKPVELRLLPGEVNTGIVFVRTDLPEQPTIRAIEANVTSTLRATTLSENGAEVFTVEHLLAALSMLSVDNCRIEMSSPEPPVMDGSAKEFCELILEAGRVEQQAERKVRKIEQPIELEDGHKSIAIFPYEGFKISFTSTNSHPLLGHQHFELVVTEEAVLREIAPARTVGFTWEVEQMRKMGLGLGGNVDNVVVYDETKVLSKLRFPDELIRHKILDVIGDMYLLGPLQGHIVAAQSGHALNAKLAQAVDEYFAKEEKAMPITLDINQIKEILPHRYPLLLVDKILDLEPMKWAVGVKNITAGEIQFLGHFPDKPIMPGVLLIEAMAQVGGIAMLYPAENRGKVVMFGKIDKVRFFRPVVPGDQVITRAEVTKVRGNMGTIHCEGRVEGEVACECDCFFVIPKQ